ncbi:Hypothetical predicted protein [Mytilus galloprovincialis]|uniref:Uncharacterized protein n=1 Tax=Mytilus galloprovincialis TaxID=29158 RepID=A0A8B6GLX0_MYTGA|nr:Hypothetical predicted protein [Mytilus galloprovincialis]
MAWFQIVSVLFIFITTINGQCQYDTASAVCFCNKEVYVREVRIVEVMSESCNCIIHLVDFNEPPTVTNMFDRECSWTCTNETCVPGNILEVTRKEKTPTKPRSVTTTTDHTEAWPTTRDSTTSDLKEAWPTTTVRVTTDSKEPHSEQKKDLGHYLQKMDVFMTVFWTVSGLFVAYVSLVVGKMLYRMRHQKLPYLPITRSQQDSTLTTQIPTLDITPSFELPTIIPVPEISTPQRPTVPRLRSIEDIPPSFTLRTYSSSSDTESFNRESSPEPSAPPMEDPTPPIARRTRSHRIKTPLTEETYM